jgi:glutathione S-transferase
LAPISAYHFSSDGAGSATEIVVHRRPAGAPRPGVRPMKLVVGDKNHSSPSMRPWVLLTEFGLPFEEVAARGAGAGPADAGAAPVLVDEGVVVRDMPAIAEFLAEKFPDRALWPRDARRRAHARSLCAEPHAGFGALRGIGQAGPRADLEHVFAPWRAALAASGGPFLFGDYSIADACCAPIALRLGAGVPPQRADVAAYAGRIVATRGVAAWIRATAMPPTSSSARQRHR